MAAVNQYMHYCQLDPYQLPETWVNVPALVRVGHSKGIRRERHLFDDLALREIIEGEDQGIGADEHSRCGGGILQQRSAGDGSQAAMRKHRRIGGVALRADESREGRRGDQARQMATEYGYGGGVRRAVSE